MRLVNMFTDAQAAKMQYGDENYGSRSMSNKVSTAAHPPLSHLDYPRVKYWDKNVWKSVAGNRKNTSELQIKTSCRGGTRSSKGENVMMLYIEDENGVPVDGTITGGMRELARSIWRSLYERGLAPETWGQATKDIRDEYFREMESEYHVLRLCDNHWKANALATAIYSQWHKTYYKDDEEGDGSDGPPKKKSKRTVVVDDNTPLTLPDSPRPNLDVQDTEDNASSSRHGTALMDPLYVPT